MRVILGIGIAVFIVLIVIGIIGYYYSREAGHTEIAVDAGYTEDTGCTKVIVQANHYGWTRTGINLSTGDIVEIVASGKIKWDDNSKEPVVGPDGASWYPDETDYEPNFKSHGRVACLIGRINGIVYPIGSRHVILVKQNGELMFSINEDWTNESAWQDNEGEFKVGVKILRKVSKYAPLDRPIADYDSLKIYPDGSWYSTGFYVPDNCLLTFKPSRIASSERTNVFFEDGEDYNNQKLYLNYKIGEEGIEHTITISDISDKELREKGYVEQVWDGGGELFIKCIDKNYKNDRYWYIRVEKYKVAEEGKLLHKGAFVDKHSLAGVDGFENGVFSYLRYEQVIYPSGKWYDTRLTIPSDCVLGIALDVVFDKKMGPNKVLREYEYRYTGVKDLKGKMELFYKVGEDGEVHNIHTGLVWKGKVLNLLCSDDKISNGGILYISGKDENYQNDRLWWIEIGLGELKKSSIDLKKLRNSDYREFL